MIASTVVATSLLFMAVLSLGIKNSRQSIFSPTERTTSPQALTSAARYCLSCAGVIAPGSAALAAKISLTLGWAWALTTSWWSLSTISFGVLAGAKRAV